MISNILKYLNYNTYYIGNNFTGNGQSLTSVESYYDRLFSLDRNFSDDKQLLPLFNKAIKDNNGFITLFNRGAHAPYNNMIDTLFIKFDKIDNTDINLYHNKILQTDYVWGEIIKKASESKQPIFMILTSDHGESFGETYNGKTFWTHGVEYDLAPIEQLEVPLIIYINDAYRLKYPEYTKSIETFYKINKNKLIDSEIISHSLLNCAGLMGKKIDKNLSICATK